MNVEIRDERFRTVVGDDVEVEEVGSGFEFTEGPIWNHVEKHLIFSDIPGNTMRRWRADGSIETWRQPSNMANGNAYDPVGPRRQLRTRNQPASPVPRATAQLPSLRRTTAIRSSTAPTTSSSSATARSTSPILALGAGSITDGPVRSNSTSRAFTGSIQRAANSRCWLTISTSPTASVFRWTSRSCSSTTR